MTVLHRDNSDLDSVAVALNDTAARPSAGELEAKQPAGAAGAVTKASKTASDRLLEWGPLSDSNRRPRFTRANWTPEVAGRGAQLPRNSAVYGDVGHSSQSVDVPQLWANGGQGGRQRFTEHLEPKPACFDENQRAIRVRPDKSVGEDATIGLCQSIIVQPTLLVELEPGAQGAISGELSACDELPGVH